MVNVYCQSVIHTYSTMESSAFVKGENTRVRHNAKNVGQIV